MENSSPDFGCEPALNRFDFLLRFSVWTGWTALTRKLNGGQE